MKDKGRIDRLKEEIRLLEERLDKDEKDDYILRPTVRYRLECHLETLRKELLEITPNTLNLKQE